MMIEFTFLIPQDLNTMKYLRIFLCPLISQTTTPHQLSYDCSLRHSYRLRERIDFRDSSLGLLMGGCMNRVEVKRSRQWQTPRERKVPHQRRRWKMGKRGAKQRRYLFKFWLSYCAFRPGFRLARGRKSMSLVFTGVPNRR